MKFSLGWVGFVTFVSFSWLSNRRRLGVDSIQKSDSPGFPTNADYDAVDSTLV